MGKNEPESLRKKEERIAPLDAPCLLLVQCTQRTECKEIITDRRTDEQTNGRTEKTDERTDEKTDGRTDRQNDGRTDDRTDNGVGIAMAGR